MKRPVLESIIHLGDDLGADDLQKLTNILPS
jgi:hypothetical protein